MTLSAEIRSKIGAAVSLAKRGHTVSEETRRKISLSKKGRGAGVKLSPDRVALMRQAQLRRWRSARGVRINLGS